MATQVQATQQPQRGMSRAALREALTGYLFISPYLITAGIFTFGLLGYVLYTSFTNLQTTLATRNVEFVGLENYIRAFQDTDFLIALNNAFWYFVIVTSVQTILSILLAVALNAKLRGMRFFRTALYAPSVASAVVMSLIFLWLYLPTGFVNYILGTNIFWLQDATRIFDPIFTGLGIENPPLFLRGPSVTWVAIMALNIFTTVPTFMVIFLAALQDIPGHLYEAAAIDGATGPLAFWHITLPLLRRGIALVVILGTTGTFLVFAQVAIMTQGGPLKTTLVPLYLIYQKILGFGTRPDAAYGAAMAFILAGIIIIITLFQRYYIEREA
jgi:multiple sugar transport system permease protein